MEVTSSSQAAAPLGSHTTQQHGAVPAGQGATGGDESNAEAGDDGDVLYTPSGVLSSSHRRHHLSLDLDLVGATSTENSALVSTSSAGVVHGENLNNAGGVSATSMELVCYGPALPPFYSSDNMSYSKDVRDLRAVQGSCGLYNLGNTCFMNAGLQSLMSCSPLVKFFCEGYSLDDSNRHTLTAHFYLLLSKIWSGQFSVVHPRKFKDFLGYYHSQFEDYRQHDCQEFLALLLDTLHEQLNTANIIQAQLVQASSNQGGDDATRTCSTSTSPLYGGEETGTEHGVAMTTMLNNSSGADVSENIYSKKGRELSAGKGGEIIGGGLSMDCCSDSVVDSCGKGGSSVGSQVSPTSEVSMSVAASPLSHVETASRSACEGEIEEEEEELIISSSLPSTMHSRSNIDEVSSSDCSGGGGGVLLSKPSLKRVSSGSPMSTTSSGQPSVLALHSEDSNQSSLSAHSTDSEHSSAFKRLKIDAVDLGRNVSSNNNNNSLSSGGGGAAVQALKEFVTSSSDCKKTSRETVNNGGERNVNICNEACSVDPATSSVESRLTALDKSFMNKSSNSSGHHHNSVNSSSFVGLEVKLASVDEVNLTEKSSHGSAADHQAAMLSPSGLPPCLDDFYSKETKTLNTNVLVSEFLSDITADSEKFAKLDNRTQPPSKEVNILQEAFGEDDKTEKVLIGQSLGGPGACCSSSSSCSGVKDVNLFTQSPSGEIVKPSKASGDLNVVHNSLGDPGVSGILRRGSFTAKSAPVGNSDRAETMLKSAEKDDCLLPLKSCVVGGGGEGDCAPAVGSSAAGSDLKLVEEEKNVQMQAYAKFNTIPERSNIRADLTDSLLADPCNMELDEVEPLESSDDDDLEVEPPSEQHTSTVEACSSVPNCLRHTCPLSELKMATQAWQEYQTRNNSVVVSTFQGQFRSTVVCSECTHVSVTYEPFMYLSLPIPHAMEQQICVTYICQHRPPVKYLLNLLKTDKVSAAKLELNRLLGRRTDEEVVMAEVLDSHVSRILDNNVLLKFMNTFNRKIYAFELVVAPSLLEPVCAETDTAASSSTHADLNNASRADRDVTDECCTTQLSPRCERPERPGLVEENQEASNQSFDSVAVNSPSSMETIDCVFSDTEASQASGGAEVEPVEGSPEQHHISSSGGGRQEFCQSSTSEAASNSSPWLYGQSLSANVRRSGMDWSDNGGENQDIMATSGFRGGANSPVRPFDEDSRSMNITSSCGGVDETRDRGLEDPVRVESQTSGVSLSKFWVDDDGGLETRGGGVEAGNEADYHMTGVDVGRESSPCESSVTGGDGLLQHAPNSGGVIEESLDEHIAEPTSSGSVHLEVRRDIQHTFNNQAASISSVSSSSPASTATHHQHKQQQHQQHVPNAQVSSISSSSGGNTTHTAPPQVHPGAQQCSTSLDIIDNVPQHSPLPPIWRDEVPQRSPPLASSTIWRDNAGRTAGCRNSGSSSSGHLSRSCPSPHEFSSDVTVGNHQHESSTLLLGAAAAKLSENPGSYFLHRHGHADGYSDREDECEDPHRHSPSTDHKQSETACEGPDWSNTFPVHNFTASHTEAYGSLTDEWKSCAICLEDLLDAELLTHVSCSGVFCQNCLELSVKHTEDVSAFCCPICLQPANMCEDFVPLASASSAKPKIRTLPMCVAFRRGFKDNTGASLLQLFGHPNIIHMPSITTGQALYGLVDTLVSPLLPAYSVLLTDGQGLKCSRCSYSSHCTGCVISREPTELTLQPCDCLTVHVGAEVRHDQVADLQLVHDDVSMAGLRSSEPTTIMDCFGAFTQSELLDEHNPWYCPRCERNQCAKKTMTVWRYPDNLIIHLKRFVYQDLASTKVDAKVMFPHEGMDVRGFLSGPSSECLLYDLHAIVCHMGGASAGHYTCYSRHPLTQQWFYYNDESVSQQLPGETEFTNGYVLFYQRQGSEVNFQPPASAPCQEDDDDNIATATTSGSSTTANNTAVGIPSTSAGVSSSSVSESYSLLSPIHDSCSDDGEAPSTPSVKLIEPSTTTTTTTTTKAKTMCAATTSSTAYTNDNNLDQEEDDEDDDYDGERRGFHGDENDDESMLTVHFGSSFPPDPLVVSSATAEEGDDRGEITTADTSGFCGAEADSTLF